MGTNAALDTQTTKDGQAPGANLQGLNGGLFLWWDMLPG